MTSSSDNKVVLYYFPGSYYSLKALLALYEKDVSFEEQYVMIMTGEQNDKWYRKINKRGLVPTLLIGGECVAESERIIDVIDKRYPHGPELVPDTETVYGKEVQSFRKFLHDIPVDCITYGVFCNQQLSYDTRVMTAFPQKLISKDFTVKRFSGEITRLRKIQETCNPDEKQVLAEKISDISHRIEVLLDVEKVSKLLDDLETVFDKIEERLEISKRENRQMAELWLFGPMFTAADITMAVLLCRLRLIGMTSRYFSDKRRPEVNEYYIRIMERPTVKKMLAVADLDNLKNVMKKHMFKKIGIKILKVAFAVGLLGLGVYGVREYLKKPK